MIHLTPEKYKEYIKKKGIPDTEESQRRYIKEAEGTVESIIKKAWNVEDKG